MVSRMQAVVAGLTEGEQVLILIASVLAAEGEWSTSSRWSFDFP